MGIPSMFHTSNQQKPQIQSARKQTKMMDEEANNS